MARDLTQCHPKLQALAHQLVSEAAKQGLSVMITDCVRNSAEQLDCVKRGTSSCYYPNSMHNWGVAFDICRNDGAGAYNDNDGWFSKVGRIGMNIGLEWGGSWYSPVDKPHFQLPDWGTGTAKLKMTYGTPDAFRLTWGTYDGGTTNTGTSKEDVTMVCTFQINGGKTIYYFDGINVKALTNEYQYKALKKVFSVNNGKDLPHFMWKSNEPWYNHLISTSQLPDVKNSIK